MKFRNCLFYRPQKVVPRIFSRLILAAGIFSFKPPTVTKCCPIRLRIINPVESSFIISSTLVIIKSAAKFIISFKKNYLKNALIGPAPKRQIRGTFVHSYEAFRRRSNLVAVAAAVVLVPSLDLDVEIMKILFFF